MKAAVLKTVVAYPVTGGSNPSLSAIPYDAPRATRRAGACFANGPFAYCMASSALKSSALDDLAMASSMVTFFSRTSVRRA